MRITRPTLVAALAVLIVTSCSTMKLSSDYDRSVDFSRHRTFDIQPGDEIKSYLLQERLEAAVIAALEVTGLTRVRADADLLVVLHGRKDSKTEISATSFGYQWGGWGYWVPYGYSGSTASTRVREVPVGTLVVDVVDARSKKLIWQAVASDTLDPHASPDKKVYRINAAMERILAGFPPKTK